MTLEQQQQALIAVLNWFNEYKYVHGTEVENWVNVKTALRQILEQMIKDGKETEKE